MGFVLVLIALAAMMLLLFATDTALSVWSRLEQVPLWLKIGWLIMISTISLLTVFLAWHWLRPKSAAPAEKHRPEPSADRLEADLVSSSQSGVDVSQALEELQEQRRRKAGAAIYLAVYGEISTGKSALVKAIVPSASTETDPRGGSTSQISQYEWRSPTGDHVIISDLPGFNLGDDEAILAEARRAHLVVFLVEGDLTQSQHEQLDRLIELQKPLILTVNKSDQYNAQESAAILATLAEKTGITSNDIVMISSGGREEVVRLLSDGQETTETRNRGTNITPLQARIQAHIDNNKDLMNDLRDTAVFTLAGEKLQKAVNEHRDAQAEALVKTYSGRAVIGALAAVAPGSDLVIQGILATRLITELCELYGVTVKEVQIEEFLKLAGGRLRKMSALTLAIAGNALKSFPGLGTLSGGLLHAVAYGMIFESLGKAAAQTLASRGELRPLPAARAFEELFSERLESGAVRFAKLALKEHSKNDSA